MVYTELTKKAINIAFKAHEGQMDRSGIPYIMHPIHLAEQMETEDLCVIAMLHDVVEDTGITFAELEKAGFSKLQLAAVRLLTHNDGSNYMDYIRKIKENELARRVKIADITHNSDLSRMGKDVTDKDLKRNEKYKKALSILIEE